ncbi:ShlB/FhaC/HecB family hemolysin secretion/activation protein [Paraburkholderia sprentiae WSM5005]|uniref:ShlB/FhaC/HecB family hemolysin secretion/activation protein n=1 Tax=Paraburkholderia sprentiae WSM5005 TaxID=754502 RepID=A0A1I9YME7_9BURK|nr:ShlB/FhaC/HecB family hemolysin secretion/activation protein [Paraburkholderia sprentiae]APA87480.1 ShlB/FhaC/HecB family hemolysin secretion/activation protein [Paraburkholderia sprentiae WSM5005]
MNRLRLIAAAVSCSSALAWGQTLPNAGSILNQTAPRETRPTPPGGTQALPTVPPPAAPVTAPGPTFLLKSITLKGNDTIASDALLAPVQDKLGKQTSLAGLEEIAARITRVYRDHGYLLAQVVIPPQDVTSGNVEMSVLEGRVGHVRLDIAAGTPIREDLLRARVAQIPLGKPLQQHELERTMLLLSDLPGIQVSSAIEAGEEPGTVDLSVNVAPAKRWTFALDVDNFGAESSGTWRLGALARLNSPFMIGDNLDLRLLGSERSDTLYGRIGYEAPINAQGTRVGVAVSRLNYALGQEFASLDAQGEATVVDFTLTHPLVRTRNQSLLGRVNLEYRDLIDNVGIVDQHNPRSLVEGSVGLSYESRDALFGGGFNSADVELLIGSLHFRNAQAEALDASPLGRDTQGTEVRATFFANRLNAITERLSVFAGVSGQWAGTTLDSSSRFLLGGPHAVRAYSPSEALVDEGFVATLEGRFAIDARATVFTFFDFGTGWYNATPRPGQGSNMITRSGLGLGAFWAAPGGISLQGTVAWRTTGPDTTGNDRLPRFYVQLTKTF